MLSNRWVQAFITTVLLGLFLVLANFGYFDFVKSIAFSVTQPVVKASSRLSLTLKSYAIVIFTLRSQLREKDHLAVMLKKLQAENARLVSEQAENERLRALLDLKRTSNFSLTAAQIVARDPSGVSASVVIDRGRRDGISPGDAVVDTAGSLVGIVQEVYDRTSKFLLITDGLVKIDARVQSSGALGIIAGSHSVGLSLQLISNNGEFKKGDRVVTSGLSGVVPPGVLIGFLDEVQSSSADLFLRASIIPAADLRNIGFVSVVTGY